LNHFNHKQKQTTMTNIYKNPMPATAAKILPNSQRRGRVNACKSGVYKTLNSLKTRTKRAKTLLMLLLLGLMITPNAIAQSTFGGGSGTETDPYIITTVAHMQELANIVNSGTSSYYGPIYYGDYFRLDADLDFSGVTSYKGIGIEDSSSPSGYWEFGGFFDGNGHVVRNLNISSSFSCKGLFGVISAGAVVKNLTLVSSSITGQYYVGGIVGYMNGNVAYTDRGVRNCKVADDVTVTGQNNVGGIVGRTSGKSDVIDCAFFGTVTGNSWVGAITGHSWVHNVYTNYGNTNVNPGQHSQNCYIGGNCTKGAVGTDGTDGTDELTTAQHVFTIVYSEYISGNIGSDSSPKVSCNGKNYYLGGSTVAVLLSYSGPAPTGYVMKPQYAVEGGTVTQTGVYISGSVVVYDDDIYTIVFPSQADAVITVASTEQKRDIGYEPWVSISIAPQQFTGSSLYPVVTITDNKSGTPVTLQENIDYKITDVFGFPNPSFDIVGNHDVYIVGIGDFGGRATAVFNIYDPIYDPSFSEGSGIETDPYIIRTTDDMDIIANKVYGGNDLNGCHFKLVSNLDYTGKTYNVIGNENKVFRGNFDGNGRTISNVTSMSYSGDNVGLFGWLGEGAVVQNVHLCSSNLDLPMRSRVGGIVGYNQGGTVAHCTVADDVTINSFDQVGGIVGYCLGGTIKACVNKANVTGLFSDVGGIAGYVRTATDINNNLNFGEIVSTNESAYVGGITGENYNSTMQNNYYAGSCTTGGIQGSDAAGQAMKGWIVSNDEDVFAQMFPIDDETGRLVGITYDGIRYVGAGETTKLLIEKAEGAPEGIIAASAGVLKPLDEEFYEMNNDVFYLLTMPTEGGNVNLTIAEGVGLTVAGYDESAKAGWKLIASPVVCDVAAATVSNIFSAPQYDLYRFNQSVDLEWENYKQVGEHYHFDLENGRGYLYATKEEQTLVFRGTYNTSTEPVEVPLVYDANAEFAGWNLVGNPFPVEAYANKSYYTMNADGTNIEPIAVSTSTAIPTCTGVMVKADDVDESIIFSRTAPDAGGSQGSIIVEVVEPVETPSSRVGPSTSSGVLIHDKAIVSFNGGDQLGKFVFNKDNAKLYIPQNGKDYAIAVAETIGEMPVNFKAAKDGEYTLRVNMEGLDLDYLHLIDNLTGADVDLVPLCKGGRGDSTSATYTFTAKTTDYASRFKLVFSTNDASTGSASDAPFAYISDGNIIITADASDATLQVIDMMGRVIVSHNGHTRCVSTVGMTAGVYVFRLIDGDSVRTQKIVID
jgi:hypothetical protein